MSNAGAVQRPFSWFNSRPGLHASPVGLRVAQPRQAGRAKRVRRSLSRAKAKTDRSEGGSLINQANCGKSPLMGLPKAFYPPGIWSKDHPRARGALPLWLEGTRNSRALFLCPIPDR